MISITGTFGLPLQYDTPSSDRQSIMDLKQTVKIPAVAAQTIMGTMVGDYNGNINEDWFLTQRLVSSSSTCVPEIDPTFQHGQLSDIKSLSLINALTNPYGQHRQQPVPEFLYQLTRMLLEGNPKIIEWSEGRILVHEPHRLEAEVLGKYFRHSRFSSFQRQLNYFGFKKFSGKGKMNPCTYMNEDVSPDVRSLLSIKVSYSMCEHCIWISFYLIISCNEQS